jgi:hypothetical protein
LVFVISEETANVSLATRGTLQRGLTPDQVSALLAGRAPASSPLPAPRE